MKEQKAVESQQDMPLKMAQIEKLSLEQQVIFYREATISLRDKLKSVLPILQAHDSKFCYLDDEGHESAGVKQLIDLDSLVRHITFPSRNLEDHDLPEDMTKQDLWNLCMDLVLELNREYGISTASMVRQKHATLNVVNFGRMAKDPIGEIPKLPKTRWFNRIAKIVGVQRLTDFVNRNSENYRSVWMKHDVLDEYRPVKSNDSSDGK